MTWLAATAPGSTALEEVLALRPEACHRFTELYAGLWGRGCDPVTLELCRLRVATILGCAAESSIRYQVAVDAGLTAELVDALPRWYDAPELAGAHRAAIAFAEQYVLDPHGLTDGQFDDLHQVFDEPALATLVLAVAMFDALTRFRLALEVGGDAPAGEVRVVAGPAPALALP